MNRFKITLITTVLISIAFFVLGFFSFGDIYESLLPRINGGFYQVEEPIGLFDTSLIPALVIGLTPLLIWTTWRLAHIISNRQRFFSALIVITCMMLAVLVRREMIKSYFARPASNTEKITEKLLVSFPLNKVNFEFYMFVGLIIGCLISYFYYNSEKARS